MNEEFPGIFHGRIPLEFWRGKSWEKKGEKPENSRGKSQKFHSKFPVKNPIPATENSQENEQGKKIPEIENSWEKLTRGKKKTPKKQPTPQFPVKNDQGKIP